MDCLRVSELNDRAREALSDRFGPDVWVVGEIHGLKAHAKTGHVYFDLVEKAPEGDGRYIAKVGCAFFQGSLRTWRRSLKASGLPGFELASGIEVKLRARVDLFVKEGRYQLVVSEIDPSYTYGAIARRRAQTIESLRASGLMELNRRLELHAIPLNIGLITSRGSAAYQDFTTIIAGSGYAFRISLYDAHMQGERTVEEVIRGIRTLERDPLVDAIVITRGGGAKTDLFVFDDLGICTAVATCTKPVVTGIGHEIDLTVADLVAHSSFVTPTDTARFLVSRVDEVWSRLDAARGYLERSARESLEGSSRALDLAAARLAIVSRAFTSRSRADLESIASAIAPRALGLTAAHHRRVLGAASAISRRAASLVHAHSSALDRALLGLRLHASSLLKHLDHDLVRNQVFMLKDISGGIARHLETLDHHERGLRLVDPRLTLRRGYSVTMDRHGKVVRDARGIALNDPLKTLLAHGTLHSVVYDKEQ